MSRLSKYISEIAYESGISLAKVKNDRNQIKLTVAVASETSLNVVLKTPKVWFYCLLLLIHRKCPCHDSSLRLYMSSLF